MGLAPCGQPGPAYARLYQPGRADFGADLLGLDAVENSFTSESITTLEGVKKLFIGAVDARNTKMETREKFQSRLEPFQKLEDASQLITGPNTGLEFLPYEKALEKMTTLVQHARDDST